MYQEKDQYSISGTTLTFTTAPISGYSIEVVTVGAVSVSGSGISTGTTAQRPASPAEGLTRYNTDTKKLELWNNVGWYNVGPIYPLVADSTLTTADSTNKISETTY